MNISTGRGTIALITLIAILSISLVVNLPGLAISPILGDLDHIFPHASQLEVQLLTILPNLFIIPFMLLAGRLAISWKKTRILVIALLIYLASGILYFFAKTLDELIVISCLLGVGAGLLIPLAAGYIADSFTGKYRMRQMGIKSGISNVSLVMATFVVGALGGRNWHLPFLVYLLPIIPLMLTPFLRNISAPPATEAGPTTKGTLDRKKLAGIVALYGFATYAAIVISYYLPFLAQKNKISSTDVGTITSVFFLAIMLPGFILPFLVRFFGQMLNTIALLSIFAGLLLNIFAHDAWIFGIAAACIGFGYGTIQPVIYDKASETATGSKATLALSIVLSMNYFAVTVAPFIVDFFKLIFHTGSDRFPFLLNMVMVVIAVIVSLVFRKSFTFSINRNYL